MPKICHKNLKLSQSKPLTNSQTHFQRTPSEENHNHLQFKFKDPLSAAGSHIKPNVMSLLHLVHTDGKRNKRVIIINVTSSTSGPHPSVHADEN